MSSLIGNFLVPSGFAYLLFVVGLLVCFKVEWRRLSWALLATSGTITLVCSSGAVATALISPLEYEYPAVHDARQFPQIKHIVVLSGYAADDPDMPLTGRLNFSSAYRVMMALQLQQQCGDCDVIVSGDQPTTQIMGDSLTALGLPPERLQLESASDTTADSATHLQPLIQGKFFLITSAGHQRRALGVLRAVGLDPVPVSTDYQMPKDWHKAELRPSPLSLFASDLAMHEYLGWLWYRLKGAI